MPLRPSRLASLVILAALPFASRPLVAQDEFAPPEPAAKRRVAIARAAAAPRIDGRLDEAAWAGAPVAGDFVQVEPEQGKPSRFPTYVRLMQDDEYLYVGIDARDPLGRRGVRVPDLRREFNLDDYDRVTVVLDAFNDQRNSVAFSVTPFGAQSDVQVYDGEVFNEEWEAVWLVRTAFTDAGWTAELRIPWATIRHAAGLTTWGMNLTRLARRANEISAWAGYPRNLNEFRMRYAGLLEGVAPAGGGSGVRLRPYGIVKGTRTPGDDRVVPRIGGEAIWTPDANTVVEATVNTDFAEADVDRQVVNLTRFSVFFPERRQFFLESANLFSVGTSDESVIVQPFFSRRIGLSGDGTPIPLVGGLRLVRRDAHSGLGLLVTRQQGSDSLGPATIGVARYSHNVGGSGRLGALVATRQDAGGLLPGTGAYTGALDGLVRFGEATTLSAMASVARNADGTTGVGGFWNLSRQTNTLSFGANQQLATRHYDPATGFVSRTDVLRSSVNAEYDWRPAWRPTAIRTFRPFAVAALIHGPSDMKLQEGELFAMFPVEFQSGAQLSPFIEHGIQRPAADFTIARGITIGAGNRDFTRVGVFGSTDASAAVALDWTLSTGGFFGGRRHRTQLGFRWTPAPRLALRLNGEVNWLRDLGLERADATTWLVQPELRAAVNPRLQLSAFWQYNSDAQRSGWNVRFAWEFRPLSYLFVVYNDLRATGTGRLTAPTLPTEQLIVKLQYLWQW